MAVRYDPRAARRLTGRPSTGRYLHDRNGGRPTDGAEWTSAGAPSDGAETRKFRENSIDENSFASEHDVRVVGPTPDLLYTIKTRHLKGMFTIKGVCWENFPTSHSDAPPVFSASFALFHLWSVPDEQHVKSHADNRTCRRDHLCG